MDQASQIREKIDLVALISEFIPLKKTGRNFKANCPFHNEKTPSFVVSPERQIWHCFGCQKGGDCFTFLMEYEHLEFVEALRTLAKRTGIELKETFDNRVYSRKEKIYDLNKIAAKFYNFILVKHEAGKKALDYLTQKRKISSALIETYQIGFAPENSSSLSAYLINKKNHKKQDLYEAGLSFERGGKIFDFFRGRIIFPLLDHRDNVVGFSGRVLNDTGDGPKYINTKETEAYHKGDLFFGLSAAKEEIKVKDQAIVVEGEFDVISCFKEGIKNVVALKGTALTENQVSLLSRFTKKVTLCLDQDEAGVEAMKRSLMLLEKKEILTTIILPNGKDPDEAIKKDPYEFKKAVKNERPVYDFLLEKTIEDIGKKDVLGKKKITDTLLPFFSQISNEVIKEHYLKTLSREIDTSYESLSREIEKYQKGEKQAEKPSQVKEKRDRKEVLEEYFMAVILQSSMPKITFKKGLAKLNNYKFSNKVFEKIIEKLGTYFKNLDSFDSEKFAKALPSELMNSFNVCFLLPLPKFESEDTEILEIETVAEELLTIFVKEKIKIVTEEIKAKENKKEEAKLLKKELQELITLLPKSNKA